jgi:hypothetical protein
MTYIELSKYLKTLSFRSRVTELYMFLSIEVSSKKNLDLINSIVSDIKQIGIMHKVTKLKWYECWFPRHQFIDISKTLKHNN